MGVILTDYEVNEVNDEQLQDFKHSTKSQIYIFSVTVNWLTNFVWILIMSSLQKRPIL